MTVGSYDDKVEEMEMSSRPVTHTAKTRPQRVINGLSQSFVNKHTQNHLNGSNLNLNRSKDKDSSAKSSLPIFRKGMSSLGGNIYQVNAESINNKNKIMFKSFAQRSQKEETNNSYNAVINSISSANGATSNNNNTSMTSGSGVVIMPDYRLSKATGD